MNALVVVLLSMQVVAGGEREDRLRYLQTLGAVPLYPWSVRAFSPGEMSRLASSVGAPQAAPLLLPIAVSARYNSTFPYGYNDGPIWAGKGITLAAEAGFTVRRGGLSLTVAPLVFLTQNAGFPRSADTSLDRIIDRPERFGNGSYARLDPGQSTLRLDWRKLAVGATTANQYWGPTTDFPLILGNNAPGFPLAFLGTSRPVDLGLFRVHGRLIWGRLGESAFAPESSAAAGARFATGLIAGLTFDWLPGLEVGVTRFSHQRWRAGGPSIGDALAMFHGGQGSQKNLLEVNQLASAFFRLVLPRNGFEVYGEYGRDDYNANVRDFVLEPDHIGGYTVGFRKIVRRRGAACCAPTSSLAPTSFLALRAELQNLQISSIARGRPWVPFYTHGTVRQGHTQLGQVLGSEAGPGGAGSVLALESLSPSGRWTWAWTRMIRQQRGDQSGATTDPNGVDVQHALSVERLRTGGRYELVSRVAAIYELNRNFRYDAFNLNLIVGIRWNFSGNGKRATGKVN